MPHESARLGPLPLVARARELELIRDLLDRAESREGGVLILRGDSGVGKSRLLRAAAEEACTRGWRCAHGRSYPVESGIPYALFSDALLPLLREIGAPGRDLLAGSDGEELAYLFPFLPPPVERPHADAREPAEIRMRLLGRFSRLLAGLSEGAPLLLALDDLQWADASSLELLHFLARQLGDRPIAIVCAYNQELEHLNPRLLPLRQSMAGAENTRLHTVSLLSHAETATLIREAFGADAAATRELSALLFGWTRGNAFFLEETLKSLVQSGRLDGRGTFREEHEVGRLELPETVREAVISRFGSISPGALTQATLLAVVGTSVSLDLLLHLSDMGEADAVDALDELRAVKILEERLEGDTPTYDFRHPILRETLYADLGRAKAQLLHRRVAESLEGWYGERATEHAGLIASHFTRSTSRDLDPRAVRYLALAGRQALERFADREAADFLETALARGGEAASSDVLLLEDLARARLRLGRFAEAEELALRLRRRAEEAGDLPAGIAAERRLGMIAYRGGRHADALLRFAAARERAATAGDESARARLLLLEAECLLELGRAEEAGVRIEEAVAIATRLAEPSLLARTHLASLFLHSWVGPPGQARAEGDRVLMLARSMGDAALECTAHWGLTMLAGLTGDPVAATEHGEAAARLAEQLGSPLHRLRVAELQIELLTNAGDWGGALALGERTITAARALNQRSLLPRVLVSTALVHFGRDELACGRSLVEEAWELSGADHCGAPRDVHTVVPAYAGRAAFHLWSGDLERAARMAEEGLAIADATGYTAWSIHRLLPLLAEAYLSMGDVENATRVGVRLRRDAERLGHRLGLAWADVCDAVLVWLRGDLPTGTRLLRAAALRLEAIPALPDATRLRRHIAARLRDQGERDEALRELRQIHEIFLRLGAERELARTREQIRELGARPPVREAAVGVHGLSEREVEIARMVAGMKSNKAIARELDISARTVSTHLSNIFRKLEIGSRAELGEVVRTSQLPEPAPVKPPR
jgi:DNA-binding CsgD family transcriptional regulator/tetratricopeptide (TPR) repeat protein